MKPQVGATLGDRYVLAAELGERPGAVEYRAFDKEVEVEVSLWWIRPELVADPARADALLGAGVELRAMHDLALRKCFGVGRGRGGVWATWQLAGGAGLLPGTEPVALAELRRWIDAVARALEALHDHGLVHGRMTPEDVVTIGGALKLGGGGLWRDVDPAAAARAWSGHDHYVAPEVRRNQPPTEASDAWSFAMIALELVAGMSGAHPDAPRAAARRHPQLAAVLVGAMSPDPAQRPAIAALAEAARNASEYPYVEAGAQPRGKGGAAVRGGDASTLLGHAASDAPVPRRTGARPAAPSIPPESAAASERAGASRRKRSTTPATLRSTKQTQAAAAAAVRLPPAPKPPSPSAQRPIVVAPPPQRTSAPQAVPQRQPDAGSQPHAVPHHRADAGSQPHAVPQHRADAGSQPHAVPALPKGALPTPARHAIADAVDRARTAPPGAYLVAAVSLKDGSGPGAIPHDIPPVPVTHGSLPTQPPPPPAQPPLPDRPTGETPALPKPKIRSLAEMPGGRTYSVAPGQMGYLAPPKPPPPLSEAREHRRMRLIVLALVAILAAGAGVAAAFLL